MRSKRAHRRMSRQNKFGGQAAFRRGQQAHRIRSQARKQGQPLRNERDHFVSPKPFWARAAAFFRLSPRRQSVAA